MTVVKRGDLGRPLTYAEMDANFDALIATQATANSAAQFATDASGNVQGLQGPGGVLYTAALPTLTQKTALNALALAASRRVDVVMIGDSNQSYNGYGFYGGLENALATRFGAYATGIIPTNANGIGGKIGSGADSSGIAFSGAPTGLANDCFAGPSGVYAHYGYGTGTLTAAVGGGSVATHAGFPVTDALTVWGAAVNSKSFSGSSVPSAGVRLGYSPYSTVANVTVGTLYDANYERVAYYSANIAADATRTGSGVEFRWSLPGATVPTAPVEFLFSRFERPAKTTGVSVHTIYSLGGQSAWDMAKGLIDTPDLTLQTYFSEVRRLQISAGFAPVVVVYINSGLNDRNEGNLPSLGPNRIATGPTSTAAYVDNIRAIQQRIKNIWTTNAWPLGELYWWIVPSHRIADPDDAQLIAYRAAIKAATANDLQTSVTDLGALMTQAQGNTNGWYASGQNYIHLTNAGYDAIGQILVNQVA